MGAAYATARATTDPQASMRRGGVTPSALPSHEEGSAAASGHAHGRCAESRVGSRECCLQAACQSQWTDTQACNVELEATGYSCRTDGRARAWTVTFVSIMK